MGHKMSAPVAIKATDSAEPGVFVGYASTWTRTPDCYGEVVKKGAFSDTLAAWKASGKPIPVLWSHAIDDPDSFLGKVLDAREDEHGLRIEGKLNLSSSRAATVYDLLKAQLVCEMSFMFDVVEDGVVELEEGRKARELRKVNLYEVSLVPIGANRDTSIDEVKAAPPTPTFTPEEVAALKALAAAHQPAPAEGEAVDNAPVAEAAQQGSKAALAEAAARVMKEIEAL